MSQDERQVIKMRFSRSPDVTLLIEPWGRQISLNIEDQLILEVRVAEQSEIDIKVESDFVTIFPSPDVDISIAEG